MAAPAGGFVSVVIMVFVFAPIVGLLLAAPSALIGTGNFFELAVAAAVSLFGFNSGAALATVVGILIEVPVMLSVGKIVNSTRDWYEEGTTVRRRVAGEKAQPDPWTSSLTPIPRE